MTLREKWHHEIEQMNEAQLEEMREWWEEKARIRENLELWKSFFSDFSSDEAAQFARDTGRSSWRDLNESA